MALLHQDGNNLAAFRLLNGAAAIFPDALWAGLTVLGDTLLALSALLFWRHRRPDIVVAVLLAAIPATLLSHGFKDYFHTPRPPAVLAGPDIHIIGPAHKAGAFPSGHTTTIFVLASVLVCQLRSAAAALAAVALAVMVGVSRIAVGVHWPQDVAGGMLCGWVSGLSGIYLVRWSGWWRNERALAGVTLFLAGCALVLLVHYDTGYSQTRHFEQAIALLALTAYVWPVFFRRQAGG